MSDDKSESGPGDAAFVDVNDPRLAINNLPRIEWRSVHLSIDVQYENGRWVADAMEFPGLLAYGQSERQAKARLKVLALRKVADEIEERIGDAPALEARGSIQWQGTNVCIDLHCPCGHVGHVDAEGFFGYRCASCGERWHVGTDVRLTPATLEEISANKDMFVEGE